MRFTMNSTFGVLGINDLAGDLGMEEGIPKISDRPSRHGTWTMAHTSFSRFSDRQIRVMALASSPTA